MILKPALRQQAVVVKDLMGRRSELAFDPRFAGHKLCDVTKVTWSFWSAFCYLQKEGMVGN